MSEKIITTNIIYFISGGRIFHSATRLNNNNILIHGGRTSPPKPCAETLLLSLKDKDESQSSNFTTGNVNCRSESKRKSIEEVQDSCEGKKSYKHTILSCRGDIPQTRWRHSATHIVLPDGTSNFFLLRFVCRIPNTTHLTNVTE